MYCLLCHEKIARLRAWRTKSEFCCDEHADMYKRQTLERLMVDDETKTAPPLPSNDPVVETPVSAGVEAEPSAQDELDALGQLPELDEWASPAEKDTPDELDGPDGLDDLWTMAGEGDEGPDAVEPTPASAQASTEDGAVSQSAEEALAALRALADGASRANSNETNETETVDDYEALLEESGLPDDAVPLPDLEEEDPLEALRLSWASDEHSEEPGIEPEEDLLEAEDDDSGVGVPSILERLMEERRGDGEDSGAHLEEITVKSNTVEEDAPFDDLLDLMDDVVAPLDEELTRASADAESASRADAKPEVQLLETASAEKPVESTSEKKSAQSPAETAAAKVVPFPVRQQDARPPKRETPAAEEPPPAAAAESAPKTAAETPQKPAATRKRKKLPLRAAMVMASIEVRPRGLDSAAGDDWEQAALRAAWGKDSAPAPLRNGAAKAMPVGLRLDDDRAPCRLEGALQARFLAQAVAAQPAEITLDAVPEPPLELRDLAWPIEWPKNWNEPPAADREALRLSATEGVVGIEPSTGLIGGAPGGGLAEALGGLAQVCEPVAFFYAAPSQEEDESNGVDSEGLGADWDLVAEENFGGFDLTGDD